MIYIVDEARPPFDIRTAPIWAIPQLGFLARQEDFTVDHFYRSEGASYGTVTVYIKNEGRYEGIIKKKDMNNPHVIALHWLGACCPP